MKYYLRALLHSFCGWLFLFAICMLLSYLCLRLKYPEVYHYWNSIEIANSKSYGAIASVSEEMLRNFALDERLFFILSVVISLVISQVAYIVNSLKKY